MGYPAFSELKQQVPRLRSLWRPPLGMTKLRLAASQSTALIVILEKGDVEGAQVGVQAGILDRSEVGALARLIAMLMPVARWGDEGCAGFPVDASWIFDVAVRA